MNASDHGRPVGIVVATHGSLARALISSAEMIVGAQEDLAAVCLDPKDNLDTFHATLDAAIQQVDRGRGVLVLIDLFGGTPGNAAALCVRERDIPVVSGVNLPMFLEVLLSRHTLSAEALAALALESGVKGIVDITVSIREFARTSKPDEV